VADIGEVTHAERGHSSFVWSFWYPSFINQLLMNSRVNEVMVLGTVLAFKLRHSEGGAPFLLGRRRLIINP
jgi:hypothetical protein